MKGWKATLFASVFVSATAGAWAQAAPAPMVISNGPGSPRTTKMANRDQSVTAPVPPLLVSAHKIFLSHGGAEAGLFPHPFTGSQDRAFAELYHIVEGSDRFQLVPAPADADIVLELQLLPPTEALGGDKRKGTGDPLPTFKLTAFDRPTHYILWTVMQTVDSATLQKTHDKNFDEALSSVWKQFVAAASGAPMAAPAENAAPPPPAAP